MADATITTKIYEHCHLPNVEVVQLTATDGETYVSKKFKTILGVIATSNSDNDAYLQATYSGQTVTIRYASMTDKLVTLMIFGKK